jgi:nucleolar protein 16
LAALYPARTDTLPALEALAATSTPVVRHTSTYENAWLHNMVAAYGDDYSKMSRDRKLHVWQKTEGEIKRAIKKAGGIDKLRR